MGRLPKLATAGRSRRLAFDSDADGINAIGRAGEISEVEIGGGKPDGAATPVAGQDGALDRPGRAEQGFRGVHVAVENGLADTGGGDLVGPVAVKFGEGGAHAVLGAQALHVAGRAGPAGPETEVGTGDQALHAQPADEDVLDEFAGRALRHLAIERQDMQTPHPERRQRAIAPRRAHQPEGGRVRGEETARMGIEQGHAQLAPHLVRKSPCKIDDVAVAEMDAVEIPQCDDRTPRGFGD